MIKRLAARIPCSIEVQACTPITTVDACIVDLSRLGAQLRLDLPFGRGARIHLDVECHFYWGTVMWDEEDRIGLRFRSPIVDGPLDDALRRLQVARPLVRPPTMAVAGVAARPAAGFGRRAALRSA